MLTTRAAELEVDTMLASLHLPQAFDAFVHLVALTFAEPHSSADVHEPDVPTTTDELPAPRPGHLLADAVGTALYHATLAGARPWGC